MRNGRRCGQSRRIPVPTGRRFDPRFETRWAFSVLALGARLGASPGGRQELPTVQRGTHGTGPTHHDDTRAHTSTRKTQTNLTSLNLQKPRRGVRPKTGDAHTATHSYPCVCVSDTPNRPLSSAHPHTAANGAAERGSSLDWWSWTVCDQV